MVRVHSVEAGVLQGVRLQLRHQADAAAFLMFIDHDAASFGGNRPHGNLELVVAVAAQRPEHLASETLRMDATSGAPSVKSPNTIASAVSTRPFKEMRRSPTLRSLPTGWAGGWRPLVGLWRDLWYVSWLSPAAFRNAYATVACSLDDGAPLLRSLIVLGSTEGSMATYSCRVPYRCDFQFWFGEYSSYPSTFSAPPVAVWEEPIRRPLQRAVLLSERCRSIAKHRYRSR